MRVKCLEVFKVVVLTCAMDAKQQRGDSRTNSSLDLERYLQLTVTCLKFVIFRIVS